MKKAIAMLGLMAIALPQGASAQVPYQGNNVYRSGNRIFISGSPNSTITYRVERLVTRNIRSNACGILLIKTGSTPASEVFSNDNGIISVGSTQVHFEELGVQTLPVCSSGTLSEPRTAPFYTPEGSFAIPGLTPSTYYQVSYNGFSYFTKTLNACGFFSVISTVIRPIIAIVFPSATGSKKAFSALPESPQPPVCRSISGQKVPYIPFTW